MTLSSKINNTARARMSFKTAKGGGWKKSPGLNLKAATSEAKGGFLRGQLYHDLETQVKINQHGTFRFLILNMSKRNSGILKRHL